MQEFFMDYGLWLLIGLLVLIGVIFLLAGRKASVDSPAAERPAVVEKEAAPIAAAIPEPVTLPRLLRPSPSR